MERFLASEEIYTRIDDRSSLATCQNNIAAIYHAQGLPEQAIRYYHNALDHNTALGDRIGQATNHMNLGNVLDVQGDLDMALAEFEKSLALFVATGDRGGKRLCAGTSASYGRTRLIAPRHWRRCGEPRVEQGARGTACLGQSVLQNGPLLRGCGPVGFGTLVLPRRSRLGPQHR
ncbi:MAG: tetratricopeptide repeat protein [Flavobacteriales bacterium]|nr:tetratricopeptide repeat protein [Flavobacteriales bacterium]